MINLKILNLFAGLGGNRYLWDSLGDFEITAVEHNTAIADEYKKLFPNDQLVIGDAWDFVEKNFNNYDIIWASPPCQSHSKLRVASNKKTLPDLRLYSLIIFLKKYFRGSWIVENVKPYYKPFIPGYKSIDRHLFWSNIQLKNNIKIQKLPDFSRASTQELIAWLGFSISKNIYLNGNHDYNQVYRNCVHPYIGLFVLEQLLHPGLLYLIKNL